MDYKLLIDTAALAGTVMLENGAEIYRVEETINYILKVSGLKTTQAFVISTGFMISLDDPDIDALTVVRRVNKSTTNLNMIASVNDISRKFYKGEITLEEAFYQIKHLKRNVYPWWLKYMYNSWSCFFYRYVWRKLARHVLYRNSGAMSCRMAAYWKSN